MKLSGILPANKRTTKLPPFLLSKPVLASTGTVPAATHLWTTIKAQNQGPQTALMRDAATSCASMR
jgi:hypothetical protein